MKSSRFKVAPRENASKGHINVYNLIRELYPFHDVYQEYPYDRILKGYYKRNNVDAALQDKLLIKSISRLFADIYDATLGLVIEVQGEHHFRPVAWDGDYLQAQRAYETRLRLDKTKRRVCVEAEILLIEIPSEDAVSMTIDVMEKTIRNSFTRWCTNK